MVEWPLNNPRKQTTRIWQMVRCEMRSHMKIGVLFSLYFQNQYGKHFNLMVQLGFVTDIVQDIFLSALFWSSCILTMFIINYILLCK